MGEAPSDSVVKPGDLIKLGPHKLLCGDSTDLACVKHLLGSVTPKLGFTSPPYFDLRAYKGGLNLGCEHLASFLVAPCDVWAVNLGIIIRGGEILKYWDTYLDHARSLGLKLLSWNVWDKGSASSAGSMNAMFSIQHEFIFVFGKHPVVLNRTEPNKQPNDHPSSTRDRQKDGSTSFRLHGPIQRFRQLGTVIKQAPQMARNLGYDFPAAFPVELAERYIKACTHQGSTVYDPFGGSGTTLMACQKTGRACLTMEIVPSYCDLIVQRWQQETGQKAKRWEAA